MRNTMRWVLSVLLVFVVGSGACRAQSTNAGDIRGSVTDTSGGLIPGVKVTVLNVDTGVFKGITTTVRACTIQTPSFPAITNHFCCRGF